MYYIGLMSGTSVDAVDAALVRFGSKAKLVYYREYPIEQVLRYRIRQVNEKTTLDIIAKLDNQLGHLFADSAIRLLHEANIDASHVHAIGSHGQTVLHRPNIKEATSIQIADPNVICAKTGITTVADFRRIDIAYGGQGAPLASAFHRYQFRQADRNIAILNIGGIANLTLLPARGEIGGFDTGPGNTLLDHWSQQNLGKEYDKDSQWAVSGEINEDLLREMLRDPYFAKTPPKSTGREHFNLDWLTTMTKKCNIELSEENIQATLLALTIESIVQAINRFTVNVEEVLTCGGGAYNKILMTKLRSRLPNIELATTTKYGLAPDCIEAVTFAWFAKKRIDNQSAILSSVTNSKKNAILGGIYSPSLD